MTRVPKRKKTPVWLGVNWLGVIIPLLKLSESRNFLNELSD